MISVQNHLQPLSGNKFILKLKSDRERCFKSFTFRLSTFNFPLKILYFILYTFFLFTACSPKTAPTGKKPDSQRVDKESSALETTEKATTKKVDEKPEKIKEAPEMVISLILPFELNSINYKTAEIADLRKAEIAIDFYQGFKMGLDSAATERQAPNYKLHVFDSNDSPTQAAILSSKAAIKNSDLIVGPVFPNGIKVFSMYSKNMKKPMVSPLAASDPQLFNNPYLITINNSLDQHAYKAADFIGNDLKPKKVLLIRSGQADEYKYAVPFKKGMDSLAKNIQVSEIGIKAIGYENVYKYLNPNGLTVIVLPSTDRVFLLTIFKTLEKISSNFPIAVIGHPGWEKAAFLDFRQLESLNAYISSSYQIDYQDYRSADFVKSYRSKFSVEPTEYAFKGFDIAYYFGLLMNDKKHQFMDALLDDKFDGIHNDFRFKKDERNGYYNNSLMMLKYENSKLVKVD